MTWRPPSVALRQLSPVGGGGNILLRGSEAVAAAGRVAVGGAEGEDGSEAAGWGRLGGGSGLGVGGGVRGRPPLSLRDISPRWG